MKAKVYDYFKELPQWAKGVVIVAGGLAIYLTASQVIKRIRRDAERRKAEANILKYKSDLNDLKKKGINPTVTKGQVTAWVSQIVNQFEGCDLQIVGNESDGYLKMAGIIKAMKNDADWLFLLQEFAVKTYDDCMWGEVVGDLYLCINDELDKTEIAKLNVLLKKSNISYTIA